MSREEWAAETYAGLLAALVVKVEEDGTVVLNANAELDQEEARTIEEAIEDGAIGRIVRKGVHRVQVRVEGGATG